MKNLKNCDTDSLIQAEYEKYCNAFKNKDIHTIMAIFAPDFRWVFTDGSWFDLEKTRSAIEEQLATALCIHEMTVKIDRLTVEGDQSIVYTSELLKATMLDENGEQKHLITEETYRDVWINTPLGWKFKLAEVLTSETTTK
jgi:ketosteroid isomerase-like protein